MIVTCMGESSRFGSWGPKWKLTHPSGNIVAAEAARPFAEHWTPHVVVPDVPFGPSVDQVYEEFSKAGMPDTKVVTLDRPTAHRMETVRLTLEMTCPEGDPPVLVRDCDNLVEANIMPGDNAVSVCDVLKHGPINPKELSFVDRRNDIVWDSHESDLITRWFCSGAYAVRRASMLDGLVVETMADAIGTLVSRNLNVRFTAADTTRYADWGTGDKWRKFRRSYRTIFLDIDGVLLQSSHRTFGTTWRDSIPLGVNCEKIADLYATGRVHVVLCTSRSDNARVGTTTQLKQAGVPYDRLIMGLPACGRLLVNDVVEDRFDHTAEAVEVVRDEDGSLIRALKEVGL